MFRKKQIVLISIIIFIGLLFLGTYFFLSEKKVSNIEGSPINANAVREKNQYYFVYLKQDNGDPDTSIIPEKLNPGYKSNTSKINIHVSFNNDGTVVEDEKMILISNYKISDSNKEKIKKIAGEKNYAEALKEIQEKIKETEEVDYKTPSK